MYKATIEKVGRKWIQVKVQGKISSYKAKVLINEISKNWGVGQTVEFDADVEQKGFSYEFTPIDLKKVKEERKRAEVARWWGYIVANYNDGKGYIYQKGVEKLEELLGSLDDYDERKKYQAQIEEMTTVVEDRKKDEYYARLTAQAQKNRIEYDEVFSVFGKMSKGTLYVHEGKVYKVVNCRVSDEESDVKEYIGNYKIECIDVTNTEEAKPELEKIAQEAALREEKKEKQARIDEVIEIIKEGECPAEKTAVIGTDIINTMNAFGSGYAITVADGYAWYIENNGSDDDNWSRNNVITGGAGAVGWRRKLDGELQAKLDQIGADLNDNK